MIAKNSKRVEIIPIRLTDAELRVLDMFAQTDVGFKLNRSRIIRMAFLEFVKSTQGKPVICEVCMNKLKSMHMH